jgi:dTDP-4-amino-4,6-dideoxygalactose transaminase
MKQKEIPFSMPYIGDDEIDEVVRVLRSKWITTGSEVTRFEQAVKDYLGAGSAVAVSSGTAALEVSLAVHEVGPGDDVITTAYTFASTAIAVLHRGAWPVLVDVEEDTFNIDPGKIEELIENGYTKTSRGLESRKSGNILKGIIPVHFGGQPAEMRRIDEIANKYGLFVIEDAAHALGAAHYGTRIGKTKNLVCFSFYSNKNLTTGEGGMIVTDNAELEKKIRTYSLHGISKSNIERYRTGLPFYDILYPGLKANMTDILAALGMVQMGKIEQITRLRRQAAAWYDGGLSGLFRSDELVLPKMRAYNDSARHLYPVLLGERFIAQRDDVILGLREQHIYPSVHFIPVHFHTFYKSNFEVPNHLAVTEQLFYREISLPLFPEIKETDVARVVETLRKLIKSY